MRKMGVIPKVGIVGVGFVGSTTAFALLVEGLASELVLIGREKNVVAGQGMDLLHGMEFLQSAKITGGSDYRLLKDCDVIVVSAGAHQEQGETRLDLLVKNAAIFKEVIPQIAQHNKKAILIIVTNPVDVMTYLAWKYSNYPKERVFGTGTSLDTARFRYFLGAHLRLAVSSVHAYILGEHGDSSFPVWSSATIGGIHLRHFPIMRKQVMRRIYQKTKNAAYEVIARKGATYYAIALTIVELIRVIAKDSNRVLPVSCILENYYGIRDSCVSVPVVLNKKGIDRILPVELNAEELQKLRHSARVIREALQKVLKA